MDVEFWIYIIIGVIYFLSRLLKKPEQESSQPAPDTRRSERRPSPQSEASTAEKPRQLTFEELLREITEGKQAQKPRQEPEFESFETDLKDEARSLEEVGFDEAENARVFKAYEDAQRQVFERKSLEETLHLQDTVVDFKKFDVFENRRERKITSEYVRLLRDPQSLRQAVIMSEILKRKF